MKKQNHFYTAQEVLQIINAAHAVGMTSIKIPGFEGEWRIPSPTAAAPRPAPPPATPKVQVEQGVQKIAAKKCLACNRDLKTNAKMGNLCVTCYRLRHPPQVEDHGDCPQCGGPMAIGRVSNEPYCPPCWLLSRDEESR